jgi:hypothetical protein
MCARYAVSVAALLALGAGLLAGDLPGAGDGPLAGDMPDAGEGLLAGGMLAADPDAELAGEPAGPVGATAGVRWTGPATSAPPCDDELAAAGIGLATAVRLGAAAAWLGAVAVWLGAVAVWLGAVAMWLGAAAVRPGAAVGLAGVPA